MREKSRDNKKRLKDLWFFLKSCTGLQSSRISKNPWNNPQSYVINRKKSFTFINLWNHKDIFVIGRHIPVTNTSVPYQDGLWDVNPLKNLKESLEDHSISPRTNETRFSWPVISEWNLFIRSYSWHEFAKWQRILQESLSIFLYNLSSQLQNIS